MDFSNSPTGGWTGVYNYGVWESTGIVVGVWFGAITTLATLPVAALDGPQPGPADAAWLLANAKATERFVRRGQATGQAIDTYLEEPKPPGESWSSVVVTNAPAIAGQVDFKFDTLPGGIDMSFGNMLEFGPISYGNFQTTYNPPIENNFEFTPEQTEVIAEGISMAFKYVFRDSSWPAWN